MGKRKKQTYFISCLFAVWGTCGLAPGTQCRLQCHSSSAAAQTRWAAFLFLLGPRVCRMCANSWLQTASLRYLCGALHVTGLLLAPSLGELGRPFLHHRWSLAHILQPRRDIEACHWDPPKKSPLPPSQQEVGILCASCLVKSLTEHIHKGGAVMCPPWTQSLSQWWLSLLHGQLIRQHVLKRYLLFLFSLLKELYRWVGR